MAKKNGIVLGNQSGAALVIALIILVVLTLISLSSSLTSISEIKVSGNKRGSTDAFYTADGGVQATIANIGNFNSSTYRSPVPGGLRPDITDQGVDSYLPDNIQIIWNPKVTFPAGVTFTSAPIVVIYHQTATGAPRGLGFSATGNVGFEYYIIDSTGTESLGSRSEVTTTAVRIMPSQLGGNL